MIEHLVLFKWAPDATPDQINAALDGLRSLRGRIAGILDVTCGENFCSRSQGFTHGLTVRFDSREALDAYAVDPAHLEVISKFINPIKADVLALDYTI